MELVLEQIRTLVFAGILVILFIFYTEKLVVLVTFMVLTTILVVVNLLLGEWGWALVCFTVGYSPYLVSAFRRLKLAVG